MAESAACFTAIFAGAGFSPARPFFARQGERAGINPTTKTASPSSPRRAGLLLSLTLLALAASLALTPAARAQAVNVKSEVEKFIKDNAIDPGSYQSVNWSKPVKFQDGPYAQAIRHVYRLRDPMYGPVTFDDIFYLDAEGRVLGSTSTTRWKGPRWGAGKEKW